jgi:hypothetical protein
VRVPPQFATSIALPLDGALGRCGCRFAAAAQRHLALAAAVRRATVRNACQQAQAFSRQRSPVSRAGCHAWASSTGRRTARAEVSQRLRPGPAQSLHAGRSALMRVGAAIGCQEVHSVACLIAVLRRGERITYIGNFFEGLIDAAQDLEWGRQNHQVVLQELIVGQLRPNRFPARPQPVCNWAPDVPRHVPPCANSHGARASAFSPSENPINLRTGGSSELTSQRRPPAPPSRGSSRHGIRRCRECH